MHITPENHKKLVRPTTSQKKIEQYPDAEIIHGFHSLKHFFRKNYYIESATEFLSNFELDYERGPVAFVFHSNKFTPFFKPRGEDIHFAYESEIIELCLLTKENLNAHSDLNTLNLKTYLVQTGFDYHNKKPIYNLYYKPTQEEDDSVTFIPAKSSFPAKSDTYVSFEQLEIMKNLFGENFNTLCTSIKEVKVFGDSKIYGYHIFYKNSIDLTERIIANANWIPYYTFNKNASPSTIFPKDAIKEVGFYNGRLFLNLTEPCTNAGNVFVYINKNHEPLNKKAFDDTYLDVHDILHNYSKTSNFPKRKGKIRTLKRILYAITRSFSFLETEQLWLYNSRDAHAFPIKHFNATVSNHLDAFFTSQPPSEYIQISIDKFDEFYNDFITELPFVKFHCFYEDSIYISLHSQNLIQQTIYITLNFS